jgi:RNA polymerase sigma-70 factor, ECF subfamily
LDIERLKSDAACFLRFAMIGKQIVTRELKQQNRIRPTALPAQSRTASGWRDTIALHRPDFDSNSFPEVKVTVVTADSGSSDDANRDSTGRDSADRSTRFVEQLTSHQRDLYAYINALLVGDSAALDVLQDTNLELWARLSDFDTNRPFLPWAYGFAYQRVLAFRKTRRRSRLVFSDEILELISDAHLSDSVSADSRLAALQGCLDKLEPAQGELIRDRYVEKLSVKTLASRLGSSANQLSVRLFRIRHALAKCVETTLALEG